MADTLSALNIPKATAFLSGANAPVTPKGYVGMRELAPIQEELAAAESQAQKDVGMADINIEKAKKEETTRDLESQAKFAKEEADKLRDLPERQAMKEKRKEFGDFKFVPTKENAQDLATLFSLVSVIGMAIGGGGKENSQAAMSAMNGMLEGHQKGRADLYKQQQVEFDKNFKAMQAAVQSAEKEYEEAVKMHLVDKEAGEMARKMALAKMHSPMLKAMEDRLGPLAVLNTLKELKTSVKNATELENKLQAQADKRQDAKDAKEAAERRHREDAAARLQQHKEDAAQRERLAKIRSGAGGGQRATQQMFVVQRAVNALGGVASAVEALGQLPSGTTGGILPNLQTKDGMFNYIRNAAGRTMSSSESKAVETLFTGITRNLAAIEASGAATGLVGLATQIEKLRPVAGDKAVDVALKMADIRRIATENIQPLIDSGLMPKQQADVADKLVKRIERAIPYTTQEVVNAAYGGKGKQTISEAGQAVVDKGRLSEAQQKRMRELEEKERAAK